MAGSGRDRDDLLSSFTVADLSQSTPATASDPLDIFLEPPGSAPGSFQGEGLLGSGDGSGGISDATFGFFRPEFLQSRRLTHFDVDTFVEEVLVKESEWLPGNPEALRGSYIFVCSHGSRDRRCGVCGPALVSRFREEIEMYSLQGKVSVSPCSHIGGHKYAGNVIVFGTDPGGSISGHWYGYVAPEDVPELLEQHIGRGEIVDRLWRGQMGLSEDAQVKLQELRSQRQSSPSVVNPGEGSKNSMTESSSYPIAAGPPVENSGCCQGNGSSSCCQSSFLCEKSKNLDTGDDSIEINRETKKGEKSVPLLRSGKGAHTRKVCRMPTWYESWEQDDTYAALAVLCAAVSVAVAYRCYKQMG
ncbi:hypothetical protein SAY86_004777 [Trapa natans]|uniref:Uncharacterized protein n=1 Tax=Trapa natans TaxID=22666 RepID=A0AAN7MF23_TRANT|nr:hypothetical protein SAY86_004777 [Trapa natans]